jgi:hypothetical protein
MPRKRIKFRRRKKYSIRGYYDAQKSPQGRIGYRSKNPELRIMKFLDSCERVILWHYETAKIDYIVGRGLRKRQRYTIVDFEVILDDGTMLLIEGKAKNFYWKFRRKRKAIENWCTKHSHKFLLVFDTDKEIRLPCPD